MAGEHGPGGTAEGSGGDVVTAEATALARSVNCPHCWAPPRVPCDPVGTHLGRFTRARRRGLLSQEGLAVVWAAAGPEPASGLLIPVAACPGDRGGISGPGGALGGTGPGTRGAAGPDVPVSVGCCASGAARPPVSGTGGG